MKKISEMSKEEFIEYRVTEKQSDRVEVEKLWEKFEKDFIEKGCTGQDLIDRVKRRITSYYIQIDKNPSELFNGVIIGVNESDFGARAQYRAAIKAYQENPQKAIEDGLVNMDGQPIKQTGFDKGAVIDVEAATQRTYIGVFKGEKDINYKVGSLVARGKYISKKPPLFSVLKFRATKSKKSDENKYLLNVVMSTDFEVVKELSDEEVEMLLMQNFKENLMSISNLKEYAEKNADNFDRMAIIKGDVFQMIDDDSRTKVDDITKKLVVKNTVLGLNKKDSDEVVVCYGNPDFPFNFQDIAQDVIAIGQPRVNKTTGEVVMVLYGAWAPKKFRKEKLAYVEPVLKKVAEKEELKPEEEW